MFSIIEELVRIEYKLFKLSTFVYRALKSLLINENRTDREGITRNKESHIDRVIYV